MEGRTSLSRSRSLSQRAAWVVAASALALTLALGGCRSTSRTGGAQAVQQTQSGATSASSAAGGSSASGSSSAALQQLQGIDNQNQSDAQQLGSAQSAAGVNYSSQQTQTQP